MIAIGRNLSCLRLSPISFLRNSNVLFSTQRLKSLTPDPEIYDVLLHKHNFSPESASLASSSFRQFRCPKRVDSILSFLEENSFTATQVEKLVLCDRRVLGFSVEGLKFRFSVFQELGISSEEIAKMVMHHKNILFASMENRIVPSLSKLKDLLPSDQHVAKLLKKLPWFVTFDLERTLIPNMEILKSCGIPTDRVLHFLYVYPRCFFVKPVIMRRSAEKVIEIGVLSPSAVTFIYAVGVFTCSSEGIWETKLQTLRDLGFSDNDIFAMFRKVPAVFSLSTKRMQNVIELLCANGKYDITNIVNSPASLGCSIEKRLEPRLQILGHLESRNLMEKRPCLSRVAKFTDDQFFGMFIKPYMHEIGKEYVTKKFVEGKQMKPSADAYDLMCKQL